MCHWRGDRLQVTITKWLISVPSSPIFNFEYGYILFWAWGRRRMHFETWSKPGLVHSHNLSTQRSKASMEYISRSYLKKRQKVSGDSGHDCDPSMAWGGRQSSKSSSDTQWAWDQLGLQKSLSHRTKSNNQKLSQIYCSLIYPNLAH